LISKRYWWCLLPVAFVAIAATFLLTTDNIHTVINKRIYRSGQLTAPELRQLIDKKHIQSIVNLRGTDVEPWFKQEEQVAREKHIKYYILGLSPHTLPSTTKLKRLVKILEQAPRPVLIHCKAGADRTGLASAISLILFDDASLKKAKEQYSLYYLVTSPTSVAKLVIPHYETWLKRHRKTSNRQNFLAWVNQLNTWQTQPSIIRKM
jgi:protein tyrosine/serine phosphatase